MEDKLLNYSLEYIMSDRFAKYSKYIIQERALPDVRDGLKPVQRRILYSMFIEGNTYNHPTRKSAKTVGFVMGNFHPHGDSSIYEAMVRMAQDWKQNEVLIDMQGNVGSIDDDPPAAMRYTEARLSLISNELLKDLDKDTVNFTLTYDDNNKEPTVLPSRFPNLLINGCRGIASGYSTLIFPHNFNEIIEGTIYRIKHPNCSLDELLEIIKGPDFPTGGTISGKEGIKKMYETGIGQIQINSNYKWVSNKNNNALVISEIPYDTIKAKIVSDIDKIRAERKIEGIIEVRDESDKDGLRIVVEIRKEVDKDSIFNYLMKNTQLSVKYTSNVTAIANKTPVLLPLTKCLDYYINHQIDVETRRITFDLNKCLSRLHIVEALIKAIDVTDETVKLIRSSKDKTEAKEKLKKRFNFDDIQAEAIVMMQLYRLTSTNITSLEEEKTNLNSMIVEYNSYLSDEKKLKKLIISYLQDISKRFVRPRKTIIEDDVKDYTVDRKPILIEDCMISVSYDGYFKHSSLKSYSASNESLPGVKTDDLIMGVKEARSDDVLLSFTNKGNYMYIPIFELFDNKWKDEGKHISSIISLSGEEKIIYNLLVKDFTKDIYLVLVSKKGLIKRCLLKDFILSRYSKPSSCMKFKDDDDELASVGYSDGDSLIVLVSKHGKAIMYHENKISLIGVKASGIKAMNIDSSDEVSQMYVYKKNEHSPLACITNKGGFKIFNDYSLNATNRLVKPVDLYKFYRSEPHYVISLIKCDTNTPYLIKCNDSIKEIKFESNKVSTIGKPIKSTLLDNDNQRFIKVSNLIIDEINSKTKTYETKDDEVKVNVVKKETVEEDKELTIFDYLEDL